MADRAMDSDSATTLRYIGITTTRVSSPRQIVITTLVVWTEMFTVRTSVFLSEPSSLLLGGSSFSRSILVQRHLN
jgi:hypothetical protein